jgi:hypothetical protein
VILLKTQTWRTTKVKPCCATIPATFEVQGVESFGFNASILETLTVSPTRLPNQAGSDAKRTALMKLCSVMSPMTPHLAEHLGNVGR